MEETLQSYSIKCFCSLWKCCETFGERCFKIGKLILPSICFQAILSPLDRSCLSYEIFKSIESSKLNKNFGMEKIRKTERLTMFQIHNRKFFDKIQTIGKIWHLSVQRSISSFFVESIPQTFHKLALCWNVFTLLY